VLKQRVITAIFIAILFALSLVFLSSLWFAVFVSAVLLIAAWEWANLSSFQSYPQRVIYCGVMGLSMFALGVFIDLFSIAYFQASTFESSTELTASDSLLNQPLILSVLLLSGTWWAVALLWVQGYPSSALLWGNRWARALVGFLVLIPSWLALIFLHNQPHGVWLVLLVVVIVAVADIGAYFSGRAFGKRKLSKDVSPGKSWEGVWGGLLACTLLGLFVAWLTDFSYWLTLIAIILPTAVVSVLGDLLESMFKRHRGIKDSGRILPGHGGILDRVDGLTAAAPIFALAIILSGWEIIL